MFQEIFTPQALLILAKVTAILLAAFVFSPFIKHPGLRSSLWITTILALPIVVILSLSSFSIFQLLPNQEQASPLTTTPLENDFLITEEALTSQNPTQSLSPEIAPSTNHPATQALPEPTTAFPWLPTIYLIGAAFVILPVLHSQLKLRLLKKSPPSGKPQQLWQTLNFNHQLQAKLHFTPSPSAPFASGILKPAILIPHESQNWSDTRLQATLLHEVAHLKHRDPLTRFLSSLVKALFWFHPLVWLAHRQLIAAQEQTCDQYALTAGIEPQDYAADLLSTATHSHTTPSQALAMARWSHLGNRIRHVLNQKNHRPLSMKKIISVCSLVTLFALTVSSIGFAKSPSNSPHIDLVSVNESVARISVTPDAKPGQIAKLIRELHKNGTRLFILQSSDTKEELAQITNSDSGALFQFASANIPQNLQKLRDDFDTKTASKPDPTRGIKWHHATATLRINNHTKAASIDEILKTESQIIKSDYLLHQIAEALSESFEDKQAALTHATEHIDFIPLSTSNTFHIIAHHPDSSIASKLTNATVDAYLFYNRNHRLSPQKKENLALKAQLSKLSDKVQGHRKDLTALIQKYGVPYFGGNTPGATEQEMFQSARQKLANFQTQRDQLKIQIKKFVETSNKDLVPLAASLDIPKNQVTQYFTEHRQAIEDRRTEIATGLGHNHPSIRSLDKKAKEAMKSAQKEAISLKAVLKTKLELIERQIKRMSEMLIDRASDSADLAQRQQTYTKAKEAYEQSREALRELKLKYQNATPQITELIERPK